VNRRRCRFDLPDQERESVCGERLGECFRGREMAVDRGHSDVRAVCDDVELQRFSPVRDRPRRLQDAAPIAGGVFAQDGARVFAEPQVRVTVAWRLLTILHAGILHAACR